MPQESKSRITGEQSTDENANAGNADEHGLTTDKDGGTSRMDFGFSKLKIRNKGNSRMIMAQILLLVTAIAWGTTFIVTKGVLDVIDPIKLLAYRFLTGFIALCPVCVSRRRQLKGCLRQGFTLGVVLGLAFILQTYGLKYASVSMSAFLSGLYVVIVAVIEFGSSAKKPAPSSIVGILSASLGLIVLSWNGKLTLCFGDVLVLLGALFFALHVILTGRIVKQADPYVITVIQFATVSVICLVLMGFARAPLSLPKASWLGVGYLGVVATAIAFLCQTVAQRYASSVHTAVILTGEPLIATAIVLVTGFEPITPRIILGGALIVVGMLCSVKAEKTEMCQKPEPSTVGAGASMIQ